MHSRWAGRDFPLPWLRRSVAHCRFIKNRTALYVAVPRFWPSHGLLLVRGQQTTRQEQATTEREDRREGDTKEQSVPHGGSRATWLFDERGSGIGPCEGGIALRR